MSTFHPIFSHRLSKAQTDDIHSRLKCDTIKPLPDNLQKLWSQIPAHIENIEEIAQPIINYLENNTMPGDYLLVQGDFGLTNITVQWAKQNNRIPVYSTTTREATEIIDNNGKIKISHCFEHVIFRKY